MRVGEMVEKDSLLTCDKTVVFHLEQVGLVLEQVSGCLHFSEAVTGHHESFDSLEALDCTTLIKPTSYVS